MASKPASTRSSVTVADPDESTPLIQRQDAAKPQYTTSVVYRTLFTSFLVSLSFGVTQVPLVYIFGLMTCEEYYKTHDDPGTAARCQVPVIQADTARAFALLGTSTTFFGVMNLFITGWIIKAFSIKTALLVSVFWPSIRLLVQNIGVEYGAATGIMIIQLSQLITIIGGPAGYVLALNAYATEIVEPAERTGTLGKLQGCAMFGTSIGFLAGGLLGDIFSIKMPFRVTFVLFLSSTVYAWLALPEVGALSKKEQARAAKSLAAFIDPIKMFAPVKWQLTSGKVKKEYGILLLGIGIFLGVLATSYIPTVLQLYGTDIFNFGTTENGWLISVNSAVRGLFLTFAFPAIIKYGRQWLDRWHQRSSKDEESDTLIAAEMAIDADEVAPTADQTGEPESLASPVVAKEETYAFDLFFTRWSLILDGVLTSLAALLTQGWQMYVLAVVLPLASGTGSSAKGVVMQMCPPEKRTDALSAISLLELVARLTTTVVFGLLFSAFADIGKTYLIFPTNAAIALIGFVVLLFARFPPDGAERHVGDEEEDTSTPATV